MPHPGNSNLYRWFLVWRLENYICRKTSNGLFLDCRAYGLLFDFSINRYISGSFGKENSPPLTGGVGGG